MRIAIVGASGYVGLELLRTALRHPRLEVVAITSEQRAGVPAGEAFPALAGLFDLRFESFDADALAGRADVAFCALPHSESARAVAALRKAGLGVVDASGDFRLRDLATYERWYGEHGAPELFGKSVYGLPELHRDELLGAQLISAPGCYPTGALLPLAPFLRDGRIETGGVLIDSKSGVSGAGRKLDETFLFGELDANGMAYNVAAHRHGPEIEQEAGIVAGGEVRVTFVPHLIPTTRGILTTIYTRPTAAISTVEARSVLADAYADEPFVRVLPEGAMPTLAAVRGTNFCDVAAHSDPHTGTLILLSSIDNLARGSSTQAIQAFNASQGWPETEGLLEMALLP